MTLLLLSLAGGLGAATRYLVDSAVTRRHRRRLPVGTLVVNLTGSLLLGIVVGWAQGRGAAHAADVRAVVGTGFCGGYTTFSTASVETVRLWVSEGRVHGVRYALLSLLGCVAAAGIGLWVGGLS